MIKFDVKNRKLLNEIIFEELKNLIVTGKMLPGMRIMEKEIARETGVSRTPIREAIKKLETSGLVIINPRKAACVAKISTRKMLEVLEVDQNMEGLAATLAGQRIRQIEKQKLQEMSDLFEAALGAQDVDEMVRCDAKFHQIIIEAAGNKTLTMMFGQIEELILKFRYVYYNEEKWSEKILDEHRLIYLSIINGDLTLAKKAAEEHVEKFKDSILVESHIC